MRGNGKDLERGQGNSWKHSLLALLSRGLVLWSTRKLTGLQLKGNMHDRQTQCRTIGEHM